MNLLVFLTRYLIRDQQAIDRQKREKVLKTANTLPSQEYMRKHYVDLVIEKKKFYELWSNMEGVFHVYLLIWGLILYFDRLSIRFQNTSEIRMLHETVDHFEVEPMVWEIL